MGVSEAYYVVGAEVEALVDPDKSSHSFAEVLEGEGVLKG